MRGLKLRRSEEAWVEEVCFDLQRSNGTQSLLQPQSELQLRLKDESVSAHEAEARVAAAVVVGCRGGAIRKLKSWP